MSKPLNELTNRLQQLAERHNVPGAVAGVDLGGETVFACHGITHVRHPLSVDADTLFQIASNSKPFTATLVMQLVEEGALGLDDPVRRHLPQLQMPDRRHDDAVTVRHLLSHRVGWDGDEIFVRQPKPPTLENCFETMARARQLVPPGGHWTYSNAGFSLAGLLVETLRQQPFAQVLRQRILSPLRMAHTCTSADEAIFHRVAMRHLSLRGREPIPLPRGGWQSHWELAPVDTPAGGIVSSAADLLRWLRFWLGRPDAGAEPPLGDEARARMGEDQLPAWNPLSGQAIGWAVRLDPSARLLCHGGLTAGYCSYTLFAPSLDLAMVVLTNSTTGGLLHSELTHWLVGEVGGVPWADPQPMPSPPALAPYCGTYWSAFGTIRVSEVDGGLELATERHPTDDGSWQPPPESPVRARLCNPAAAVAHEPEAMRGALIDFDTESAPPAWLRTGGRIAVRV